MTAATMTCVTHAGPDLGVCHDCDDVWPLDELGEDANGDPQCPDCRSTSEGLLDADCAAYRAYAFGG